MPTEPDAATRVILRNSAVLYLGEVLSRGFSAALVFFIARGLGASATGKYIFVSSLAGIGMIALDYGPTQYYVRTVLQDRSIDAQTLLIRVALIRLVIAIGFSLLLCGYALAGVEDSEIRSLLFLGAISLPPLGVGGAVASVLRAQERMGYEAVNRVLIAAATLLFGGVFIAVGLGVTWLGAAMVAGATASMVFYLTAPRRLIVLRIPHGMTWTGLRTDAAGIWPFFLLSLLLVTYLRVDTFIVQQLLGSEAVGEYGVGLRVMEVFLFVPIVLGSAVFPALARGVASDRQATAAGAIQGIRLLTAVTIPVAVVGTIAGPTLIPLIFGRPFVAAGGSFAILIWAIVPMSISIITTSLIAAGPLPIASSYVYALMITGNTVGNILVSRSFGINAVAAIRVATESLGVLAGSMYIARSLGSFPIWRPLLKSALVTVVAATPLALAPNTWRVATVAWFFGTFALLQLAFSKQAVADRKRLASLLRSVRSGPRA